MPESPEPPSPGGLFFRDDNRPFLGSYTGNDFCAVVGGINGLKCVDLVAEGPCLQTFVQNLLGEHSALLHNVIDVGKVSCRGQDGKGSLKPNAVSDALTSGEMERRSMIPKRHSKVKPRSDACAGAKLADMLKMS